MIAGNNFFPDLGSFDVHVSMGTPRDSKRILHPLTNNILVY
jgi:hypothetical protein